jgi:hypothetical protein
MNHRYTNEDIFLSSDDEDPYSDLSSSPTLPKRRVVNAATKNSSPASFSSASSSLSSIVASFLSPSQVETKKLSTSPPTSTSTQTSTPFSSAGSSTSSVCLGEGKQTTTTPATSQTLSTTSTRSFSQTQSTTSTKSLVSGVASKVGVGLGLKDPPSFTPTQKSNLTSSPVGTTTNTVTPVQEVKKSTTAVHIDLTDESWEKMLLPGAPFSKIKNRHKLFFSYDPRGAKDFVVRYCPHCHCPKNYCSDIVMGDIVTDSVLYYVYKDGLLKKLDRANLIYKFQATYSEQVSQKMLVNGITYGKGFSLTGFYEIPECMNERLQKMMLRIEAAQREERKKRWATNDTQMKEDARKAKKRKK